ncbi:hypothetical protein BJX64DRAFT_261466 [Aspergillus heterothallicus]
MTKALLGLQLLVLIPLPEVVSCSGSTMTMSVLMPVGIRIMCCAGTIRAASTLTTWTIPRMRRGRMLAILRIGCRAGMGMMAMAIGLLAGGRKFTIPLITKDVIIMRWIPQR